MKSSQEILDQLSQSNYQNSSHPRFSKEVNSSYSKGYVKGFTWVDEMCDYYFGLEKGLIVEFKMHLEKKLEDTQGLPESKYKEGLQQSLKNALVSIMKD